MTDDKPMSAEERAAGVIDGFDYGMSDGLRDRLIREFATALRDHAAEAAEAEREACAKIADQEASVVADDGYEGEIWVIQKVAATIRARTEGGVSDD